MFIRVVAGGGASDLSFSQLISHLGCYAHAAPQLRRQCGAAQCGPYRELELSLIGVSQRCRTLLCDLECTRTRLAQQSACRERGRPALQYLLTYSQIQVLAWLRDLLGDASARPGGIFWRAMPRSCLRLICGQNSSAHNCTLPTI
uniref:DUF3475 domain-containing protein n=1 Tax=Globodera pallida TaxID=36090 RepID=A0A183BP34_GLOPA